MNTNKILKQKQIKVSIHQPEYLPYRGHFFKISQADIHIFLDDVKASRGGGKDTHFQYRNRFPDGWHNVEKSKIHSENKINEIRIPNLNMNLADWNIPIEIMISRELGYNTKFLRSSEMKINYSSATDRLVQLVKYVGGSIYISGKGGHNYMDYQLFKNNDIEIYSVEFFDDKYYSTMYHLYTDGLEKTKKDIKSLGKLIKIEV